MLEGRQHGFGAGSQPGTASSRSLSLSLSAASSPMTAPLPTRKASAAGSPAEDTQDASHEQQRAEAAIQLLTLHAALAKLLGPQAGQPSSPLVSHSSAPPPPPPPLSKYQFPLLCPSLWAGQMLQQVLDLKCTMFFGLAFTGWLQVPATHLLKFTLKLHAWQAQRIPS